MDGRRQETAAKTAGEAFKGAKELPWKRAFVQQHSPSTEPWNEGCKTADFKSKLVLAATKTMCYPPFILFIQCLDSIISLLNALLRSVVLSFQFLGVFNTLQGFEQVCPHSISSHCPRAGRRYWDRSTIHRAILDI